MNSNVECRYPVPEGMTPRESQKQQVEQASNLRTVLEMLRQRSDVESISILKSIREASTLDDAVGLIADANLLLPARSSPQGSCKLYTFGMRKRKRQALQSNNLIQHLGSLPF